MNKKLTIIWVFLQTRWLRKFETSEQVVAFQDKKIRQHLNYMQKHSAFYAEQSLDDLPIMDKRTMMDHFDTLNTVHVKKEKAFEIAMRSERDRSFTEDYNGVSVGLSSGTSGHRGLFLTSVKEQGVWAGTILAKMLPEGDMFSQKIGFFLRANNNLYETLDSKLLTFRYFDLMEDFNTLIDELIVYQPTILVAPASVLVDIAKSDKIRQAVFNPKRVISVAEVLEDRDASYLKDVFGLSVIHQIYQCTEGLLACTCEEGHLHINEDMVRIEKDWLDDKRFYPIITDFRRTSQPFIRYKLNDILVINNQPCACGSPFTRIEKIEGRDDDVFIFEGLRQAAVRVYPDFIRRCILNVDGIIEYQVAQVGNDTIEVRIDNLDEEMKRDITDQFSQLARKLKFQEPVIVFSSYKRDRTRKLKRIINEKSE